MLNKILEFPDLYYKFSNAIISNFMEISTNKYGNYIINIILEFVDKKKKVYLLQCFKQYNFKCTKYSIIIFKKLVNCIAQDNNEKFL